MEIPTKYTIPTEKENLRRRRLSGRNATSAVLKERSEATGATHPARQGVLPEGLCFASPEFYTTLDIMNALIMTGAYEKKEEVIDDAIAIREKLISIRWGQQ